MSDFNAFVSPEYPVLHSVRSGAAAEGGMPAGYAAVALGLLVNGIPSFLATVPVEEDEVEEVKESLDAGDVRVAVMGISVESTDLPEGTVDEPEPWAPPQEDTRTLPAAYLSLVCADGRRIGVARIVAREESASPEDVARFVLKQIARGVQIPDLASTS